LLCRSSDQVELRDKLYNTLAILQTCTYIWSLTYSELCDQVIISFIEVGQSLKSEVAQIIKNRKPSMEYKYLSEKNTDSAHIKSQLLKHPF